MGRLPAAAWLLLGAGGCLSIASSVATPTALERQLLGVYEELDEDLIHASSVRGGLAAEPGSYESHRAFAIEGRALQRFNEDDLAELKAAGCLAEALDASLVARPCALVDAQARLQRVVEDENRARRWILTWAAHALAREAGRVDPAPGEIAEIRSTYHRLLREAASPGHLFEREKGVFEEAGR